MTLGNWYYIRLLLQIKSVNGKGKIGAWMKREKTIKLDEEKRIIDQTFIQLQNIDLMLKGYYFTKRALGFDCFTYTNTIIESLEILHDMIIKNHELLSERIINKLVDWENLIEYGYIFDELDGSIYDDLELTTLNTIIERIEQIQNLSIVLYNIDWLIDDEKIKNNIGYDYIVNVIYFILQDTNYLFSDLKNGMNNLEDFLNFKEKPNRVLEEL